MLNQEIVAWLLGGALSIQYQTRRDLTCGAASPPKAGG